MEKPGDSTLVLIHSLGQDGRAWDLVREYLPDTLEIIAPSIEDFGVPIDLDASADKIAESVTGPIDVVGVAFGGIVAQHLMVRHTSQVRSAILVNTPAKMTRSPRFDEMVEEAAVVGLAPLLEPALKRWFTESALSENGPGVKYIKQQFESMDPTTYVSFWRAMRTHNLANELTDLDVPVTLIIARDDPVAAGAIHELHRLLRSSEIREVGGSHMVHLENPRSIADEIQTHLAGLER